MKKIALFCVICLLFTVLPGTVSAKGDISFEVSNITEDIITVSGSVPTDKVVTIIILNNNELTKFLKFYPNNK